MKEEKKIDTNRVVLVPRNLVEELVSHQAQESCGSSWQAEPDKNSMYGLSHLSMSVTVFI